MDILIIESSPHARGESSSNLLAERFADGAREKGHKTGVFDAGHAGISPCAGCNYCGMSGPCALDDGMTELRRLILSSDMTVFVTPLYYFGFSAQLKAVIDRFYAFNGALAAKGLHTALITAAWDDNADMMDEVAAHYKKLCRYLRFTDRGMILATGCGTVSMTSRSPFMRRAYELGKSI